jgi:acyl-CoA synthetase (AMP-forming)/AMP-acid ligase II/pimeloyl-ACP methyl ester carboxylesterase
MARLFSRFEPAQYLPYPSNFIDIDGVKLHFYDIGPRSSRAVILLHGNPTWSFYYRNLMRALAVHHRVIVPDHIGCGLSDHPMDRHYRATERVDHLERLLDHAGVSQFSLVMHDWGGPIGTALAQRRVPQVERLVYLNTTLTETEHLPGFIRLAANPLLGRFITQRTRRFLKLMLRFGVVKPLPADVAQGYLFPYQSAARRTAIWDFVQDIPFDHSHPSYTALMEVAEQIPLLREKPVLIYWGLRDPCFHRSMLTQVSRHFPQAEVVEVAKGSHLVLEDASEDACSRISEFLTVGAAVAPQYLRSPVVELGGAWLYQSAARYAAQNPEHDALIVVEGTSLAARTLVGTGSQAPLRSARMVYEQFFSRVRQYERGLSELGMQPGDRVVMLVPPGVDFLCLSYAVMGRGAVPVFLDPGMGRENLFRCLADLAPHGFIGAPKAHLLRYLKRSLFRGLRFSVSVSELAMPGSFSAAFLQRFSPQPLPPVTRGADDPALIAFTSGATGTPKGVVFTNRMLEAQCKVFSEDLGLTAGNRDLPLLPVFSLFSLALGVGSVFAPVNPSRPLDLDPELISRVVHEFKVHSSFGSPTLWQKIAEYCVLHQRTLESLQQIFMAGAPVAPKVLELVQRSAPHARVATPYGATEALPVTMIQAGEILAHGTVRQDAHVPARGGEIGTPVGHPVRGVEVRIIAISDDSIPNIKAAQILGVGEIGEVIVRGANVSPAYLHRPDANSLGKIPDPDGFWHRMGDTGYLDGKGNLFFCGRKAHRVRTPDRVYYTDPVERIFNEHPKVRRSALIAWGSNGEPAVVVEPWPQFFPESEAARREFSVALRSLALEHELTRPIERFFFHPSFPVDARHNAKIFRDKLGVWASTQRSVEVQGEGEQRKPPLIGTPPSDHDARAS